MLQRLLKNHKKRPIQNYLKQTHGYDLAQAFLLLSDKERETLYQIITIEQLAELMIYLDDVSAVQVFNYFDSVKQQQLLNEMEPDDAADFISQLPDNKQQQFLKRLSDVESLIQYDEDVTGSAMTTRVLTFTKNLSIKEATKKVIQEAPDVETISHLFVTDDEGKYLGTLTLKALLKSKPPQTVFDLIENYPFVYDTDPIMNTVQAINRYDAYDMPVCDENQHLLGMITLDDALDRYEEEAQEDFEKLAALPDTIEAHPFKIAMHRLPWLVLLLLVSIPVSLITSLFQEVITTVAIIVIFQPLISGSAGNVATQTLAVTLRMFQTGEKGLSKNLMKEVLTGLFNGIVIGVLAFGITYGLSSITHQFEPLSMAIIVSVALTTTVFMAPIIAILIPSLLKVLKQDPAVASGPLMTTLIDITTVFVYFGLSTIMLL